MTLKPEHIRVNEIELANEKIFKMNTASISQAEEIKQLTKALKLFVDAMESNDLGILSIAHKHAKRVLKENNKTPPEL